MMGVFVLIVVIIVLILMSLLESDLATTGAGNTRFKKKWPALSDDEFLERCPPGTNRETALKVRKIVAEQLGLPYDHIYPEQHFVNDLGCG